MAMAGKSTSAAPVSLHDHALDNLRYIRDAMARAEPFTAVPGKGGIAMGIVGLAAGLIAFRQTCMPCWLGTWLSAAVVAFAIGVITMNHKARAAGTALFGSSGRRFAMSFAPAMSTGGLLTVALWRSGQYAPLPGIWLLLYGAGVVSGGAASSVRLVPLVGVCFMALGAAALFSPSEWGDVFLTAGFGVMQILFGWVVARRYGG
jgi:hypothetical protein